MLSSFLHSLMISSRLHLSSKKWGKYFIKFVRRMGSVVAVLNTNPKLLYRALFSKSGSVISSKFMSRQIKFRTGTTDYNELLFLKFEWNIPSKIATLLKGKPVVLIDAGCSLGLSTIKISEQLTVNQTICIDPAKESLNLAKENLSYVRNLSIYGSALAGFSGVGKIKSDDLESPISYQVNLKELGPISVISLNDLWEQENLYGQDVVLKLDVEGGEYNIFDSNSDISWLNDVILFMIEFHDDLNGNQMIKNRLVLMGYKEVVQQPSCSIFISNSVLRDLKIVSNT